MIAAYYAQVELIDDQVGRMLDALEQSAQLDNTIVIYMSDHGEMLGDHELELKGCRFYEGAVHMPLIISWPKHFIQGMRSAALVELTDVVPTLLETLGLAISPEIDGQSLYPLLTGKVPAHTHHRFVRCEYHDALNRPHRSHANMIFDGHHKLIVYHGLDMGELYDLWADPCEFVNLWDNCDAQQTKHHLIKQLFDATMLAMDSGQPRVGRY